MRTLIVSAAAVLTLISGTAMAYPCNRSATLTAIDRSGALTSAIEENPSLCSRPIGHWGYDSQPAIIAAIRAYYHTRRCTVDQSYLIQNLVPTTPVCQIQWYVRFL